MRVPDAWKAAQDRLRSRIWAARAGHEGAGPESPSPLSAPLQPPELVAPPIDSPRPFVGRPIGLLKRTLHRLLVPLVFAPQAEFNLRVAAHLNESGSAGDSRQLIQDTARELAELQGEVLAVRAELQSQRVLLEKVRQARATEPSDAAGTGPA